MKKIVSLLLTAVMLAAMLTVFAVPAFAEGDLTVNFGDKGQITDNSTYGDVRVNGVLVVRRNVILTVNTLSIHSNGVLFLESGAKIRAKTITIESEALSVTPGSSIEVEEEIQFNCLTLEPGAVLKAKKIHTGDLTVYAGAKVITSNLQNCAIDLYGILKNPEGTAFTTNKSGLITCHDGALLDLTFNDDAAARSFAQQIESTGEVKENRFYNHTHTFDCPCVNCGEESNNFLGSTLSEGSLTVICSVAAAVIFGLGGFFIGTKKKKKPALASGTENTDEE